jgi:hypothetical protein
MPIEMDTCMVRNEGLMTAPADDEIVILNLPADNYLALDEIGRRIWELLETPCQVDELCRKLSLEYAATSEQIATDVVPFLAELEKENMIHVVEPPGE